jgi:hypothetical protein
VAGPSADRDWGRWSPFSHMPSFSDLPNPWVVGTSDIVRHQSKYYGKLLQARMAKLRTAGAATFLIPIANSLVVHAAASTPLFGTLCCLQGPLPLRHFHSHARHRATKAELTCFIPALYFRQVTENPRARCCTGHLGLSAK